MRVSARVDYAVRALVQLAADDSAVPIKAEHLATSQQIPPKFLLEILRQLKQKKLLVSRRGPEGGYVLARYTGQRISDVVRLGFTDIDEGGFSLRQKKTGAVDKRDQANDEGVVGKVADIQR